MSYNILQCVWWAIKLNILRFFNSKFSIYISEIPILFDARVVETWNNHFSLSQKVIKDPWYWGIPNLVPLPLSQICLFSSIMCGEGIVWASRGSDRLIFFPLCGAGVLTSRRFKYVHGSTFVLLYWEFNVHEPCHVTFNSNIGCLGGALLMNYIKVKNQYEKYIPPGKWKVTN